MEIKDYGKDERHRFVAHILESHKISFEEILFNPYLNWQLENLLDGQLRKHPDGGYFISPRNHPER